MRGYPLPAVINLHDLMDQAKGDGIIMLLPLDVITLIHSGSGNVRHFIIRSCQRPQGRPIQAFKQFPSGLLQTAQGTAIDEMKLSREGLVEFRQTEEGPVGSQHPPLHYLHSHLHL